MSLNESLRNHELDKSPSRLSFNDSFHFKPDYESPLPSYQELQSCNSPFLVKNSGPFEKNLEDALRKQISLQFLLGIHKIHDIFQQRSSERQFHRQFFDNLCGLSSRDKSSPKIDANKEVALLKEHLVEELQRLKSKQRELDLLHSELSLEPWASLKDPHRLYERAVQKQEELWSCFQRNHENPRFFSPKQEKLWAFVSQGGNDAAYRETVYQYQEFLMQEHVKVDLLRQRLAEEGEKLRREEELLEREKTRQLDYEVFEETKEKIKEELNNERKRLGMERRKMALLLSTLRNYLSFKEGRPFDWDASPEDFVREIFGRIESEDDVYEKDAKRKQQIKRLKEDCHKLINWAPDENSVDPYENIAGVLGNISARKDGSQEDEIQRKLFQRKEEMLQHKQKELEALKKLLEKESSILQEEKVWLANEKSKLNESTKKSKILRVGGRNQWFFSRGRYA